MEALNRLRAELGPAVRAHQRAVDAVDEATADALGVNRTDLRCLDLLLESGALAPSRLSAELELSTGSVTTMLDRLERLGYVTRSPDPEDRRKVVIRATDAVREKADAVYGPIAADGAEAVAGYSAAELETVLDFLNRDRARQERHAARIRNLTTRM